MSALSDDASWRDSVAAVRAFAGDGWTRQNDALWAAAAEALELRTPKTVVVLGSGDGWFAACVAHCLGAGGRAAAPDGNLRRNRAGHSVPQVAP